MSHITIYICQYHISSILHESLGYFLGLAYSRHPIGQRQQSLFHLSRQAPHALTPRMAFGVLVVDPQGLTQLHQDAGAALAVGLQTQGWVFHVMPQS